MPRYKTRQSRPNFEGKIFTSSPTGITIVLFQVDGKWYAISYGLLRSLQLQGKGNDAQTMAFILARPDRFTVSRAAGTIKIPNVITTRV